MTEGEHTTEIHKRNKRNNTLEASAMTDNYIDYEVTLTVRLTTRVTFANVPEGVVITKGDAIDNAIGSLPCDFEAELVGSGFTVAFPIDGEAEAQ